MINIVAAIRMAKHVRWYMNVKNWTPTKEQWLNLTSSIPIDELNTIEKYQFQDNAKSSLIGQIMIRSYLTEALNRPSKDVILTRNDHGRPVICNDLLRSSPNSNSLNWPMIDFNVSHSGDFCVFVGFHNFEAHSDNDGVRVGVDVTKVVKKQSKQELDRFLGLMSKQFLPFEWTTVTDAKSDRDKCIQFTRLWCLKESFIKAIGLGLAFNLNRIEFVIKNLMINKESFLDSTCVKLDGVQRSNWSFLETMLDDEHIVVIGYEVDVAQVRSHLFTIEKDSHFREMTIEKVMEKLVPMREPNEQSWMKFMKLQTKPE